MKKTLRAADWPRLLGTALVAGLLLAFAAFLWTPQARPETPRSRARAALALSQAPCVCTSPADCTCGPGCTCGPCDTAAAPQIITAPVYGPIYWQPQARGRFYQAPRGTRSGGACSSCR